MLKNLKLSQKMVLGVILVIMLTCIMGIMGIIYLRNLEILMETMYKHPFTISNTALEIESNIAKMYKEMKDIALATDNSQIENSIKKINELEDKVNKSFEIIYERFLGDKKMIDEAYQAFKDWKLIRDEIIRLTMNDNKTEAAIIQEKSAKEVAVLDSKINELLNFAQNHAEKFYIHASNNAGKARIIVLIMLVVTSLVAFFIAMIIVKSIISPITKLVEFAQEIANGNLAVEEMKYKGKDEIGILAKAFNEMRNNLRAIIEQVTLNMGELSVSSQELSAAVEKINAQTQSINSGTQEIAAGMEETSVSTEEISSSVQEINRSSKDLAQKAEESNRSVKEIESRVSEMKTNAEESWKIARKMYEERQAAILKAIEESKVVKEIEKMAGIISEIANQTNLLALNAAIEAARAREQGQGFAVVADEIRQLAEQSAETVAGIQEITKQVQAAFQNLLKNAESILEFINEKVASDYEILVKTGEQYLQDVEFIRSLVEDLAITTEQISSSIEQVNQAIASVAITVDQAANNSQEISESIAETTKAVEEVAVIAQKQSGLVQNLHMLVQKFKV
ncbi:hypothetical protein BBF96_03840 [Anoxybacter fermentans]|uniref:Chemotaxis protein n=1 Tax=Anoxybacter fermentans TaxID=1323375 RepID=A0A3S9SW96_9FIRM|nr:methyl-accepting chemotaxis protein [Anoxybacter fermentans]AZR72593.1 hypothetical protein BBF96_03840 [Anoxybacter fermentans]